MITNQALNTRSVVAVAALIVAGCSSNDSQPPQTHTSTPQQLQQSAPTPTNNTATLNAGFDQRGDSFTATVLGLGLDVKFSGDAVSFEHAAHISGVTGKRVPSKELYQLEQLEVRSGKAHISVGEPSSVEVDGNTLWRRYSNGITERYDHLATGLEQTVIIDARPVGAKDTLELSYEVRTEGAHTYNESTQQWEVRFEGEEQPRFTWGKLIVTDATGRQLPSELRYEDDRLVYEISGTTDAQFPLNIDPLAAMFSQRLEGSEPGAGFGFSTTADDLNDDGISDLIVGQALYSGGESREGRALVFLGQPSGSIAATASFTLEGDQANAFIAGDLATAGDVDGDGISDLAISGPFFDTNSGTTSDGGRLFLVQGASNVADLQLSWTFDGQIAGARVGDSISISGDSNCDGRDDLLAGSRYSNGASGQALIFFGADSAVGMPQTGGLSTTPDWTLNGTSSANLGKSVTFIGNPTGVTGTGGESCDAIAIGSVSYTIPPAGANPAVPNAGRVQVFEGSPTGPATTGIASWEYFGQVGSDALGQDIASGKDLNGDGIVDLAVSSRTPNNSGKVDVFFGDAANIFGTVPDWTFSPGNPDDYFGLTLLMADDLNGDTASLGVKFADLIVGSGNAVNTLNREGRVDVFYGLASGLGTTPNWTMFGQQTNARFGAALASADFNKDGLSDIAIGGYGFDSTTTADVGVGRVDIFHGVQTCYLENTWLVDNDVLPLSNCQACDATAPQTPKSANEGNACDDSDLCTSNTTCQAGACAPTDPVADVVSCAAPSGVCKVNACNPATGMCEENDAVVGTSCDDGDACTENNTCDASGACIGDAVVCTDGDLCTTDSCDSAMGCVFTDVALDCTGFDGDCTSGQCDPATGACAAVAANDGGACNDGDACTETTTCSAGSCTNGTATTCDDMNECTADLCDPATGCGSTPVMAGVACTDTDMLACTAAQCDGMGGCQAVVTSGCAIGGVCFNEGDENPANPCEVCNSMVSQTAWTAKTDGTVCVAEGCLMDGRFQPESTCQAGACNAIAPDNCGLYNCDDAAGCLTNCVDDASCVTPGAFCNAGAMECVSDGTNLAPNADAGLNQDAKAGDTVTLDASASSDPNVADTLSFEWEFVESSTGSDITLADTANVTVDFEVPREAVGTVYTFRVTVTDSAMPALSDTAEVTVTIDELDNSAPDAVIDGPTAAKPGETITLISEGTTDPDGDEIASYQWVLVDEGNPAPAELIGLDADTLEITFNESIQEETVYTFQLTATDALGATSDPAAEHQVTVSPEAVVEPDMGMTEPDMGMTEPDMDTPEEDMGTPEEDMGMSMADMGEDNGGELRGSSCFCASVDHGEQNNGEPVWLLGLALGFVGILRRRR